MKNSMNNINFDLYAGEQSQYVIYNFDSFHSLKDQFDQRGCVYLVGVWICTGIGPSPIPLDGKNRKMVDF